MNSNNVILDGKFLEVASYANHKEATILISVLDQPDECHRIIEQDTGEKYCSTIIGYPLVAKLKKNFLGKPTDFGGHEKIESLDSDGNKVVKFDTVAVGSFTDAWIEERELPDYEGKQNCILAKCKLWTTRFPEYFKVFDKLWEKGKVKTSWELTTSETKINGDNKILKVFEFIGVALLGEKSIPAVTGAGVLEYAELEDNLDSALEKDLIDVSNEKEVNDLSKAKNQKTNQDEQLNNENVKTAEDTNSSVEVNEPVGNNDEDVKEQPDQHTNAEPKQSEEPEQQIAELTDGDIFRKLSSAINEVCDKWGWISYWFPESKTVLYHMGDDDVLHYKKFTYVITNDVVTISEPEDVELKVSPIEANTMLAEKQTKIDTLESELAEKNKALVNASSSVADMKDEIAELTTYKEKFEEAELQKIEAENEKERQQLKDNMLKGDLFTEAEVNQPEIAELIKARDKAKIDTLIADRFVSSFMVKNENVDTEVQADQPATVTASLEDEDEHLSPSDYVKKLIGR